MARNSKASKNSVKKQVSDTHRYCLYCKAHRDGHGFDKHQAACKTIWQIQRRQKDPVRPQSLENRSEKQTRAEKVLDPCRHNALLLANRNNLKGELQVDGDTPIPQCSESSDEGDSETGPGECNYQAQFLLNVHFLMFN